MSPVLFTRIFTFVVIGSVTVSVAVSNGLVTVAVFTRSPEADEASRPVTE